LFWSESNSSLVPTGCVFFFVEIITIPVLQTHVRLVPLRESHAEPLTAWVGVRHRRRLDSTRAPLCMLSKLGLTTNIMIMS
jgi:hypothetical protein